MHADPLCGACGHARSAHRPEDANSAVRHYSADGHVFFEFFHGRCEHEESLPLSPLLGRPCRCLRFIPDPYPRLTWMLGYDPDRSRAPRWLRPRPEPTRSPMPIFDLGTLQRGDLIEVTYGAYRTTQRVADVSCTFDQVTVLLDPA